MDLAVLIFSLSIISTNVSVTAFKFQSVLEPNSIKFENDLHVLFVWVELKYSEALNMITSFDAV